MSDNKIYGVDIDKSVTPLMVRDAIVTCFCKAHQEVLADFKDKTVEAEKNRSMVTEYVTELIKQIFNNTGGDFDNPTKTSLLAVVSGLKEFSASFRKPEVIARHAAEIQTLIDKIN